ncbi:hypothetical protein TNCV_5101771 [Trichonephila clavipes]|nr:hypothetical protein TNCV_5101771 [Trichonephila clavipes]
MTEKGSREMKELRGYLRDGTKGRVRTRTSDVDETRQYGGSGSPELKYCFYGAWRTLKNSQSVVYTPSDNESDHVRHGVTPAVSSRDPHPPRRREREIRRELDTP